MLIRDAFDIPETTDLDTFITRLDTRDPDRIKRDLASFVLVDSVFEQVDKMLHVVGDRFKQGLDVGRFVHGTFGCGKSHLMAVLSKMFESEELVYEVGDPRLRELRGRHGWVDQQNLLVVRLNMMGKSTLVRGLYDAYHAALPPGTAPAVLTNHARVFELIDRDAERVGPATFFDMLVKERVLPNKAFYDAQRNGSLTQQLSLAALLLRWRDGDASVRPESLWVKDDVGFERIATHASHLGYTAIVWMIDELIIWIRGKARQEYIREINALSALVDHDCPRALPFLAMLAVQQDISATCPEDLSEKEFHDQLGFVSNRFSPWIHMAEQDLFEVTSRRVLKPKDTAREELATLLDREFAKNGKVIETLAGNLPIDTVRRVYPFHPALIRMLVDVTQSLSRSRTAMAALYGLLEHYAHLAVGRFIPVGALYPLVFDSQSVEGVRDRKSRLTQLYVEAHDSYERLQGKIEDVGGRRALELHQLVRTVLMCQLSRKAYFPDGRSLAENVTATTLLRMNQSDVKAITERTGISHVVNQFRALASADLQVQVVGAGNDPKIEIKTEEVDSDALLSAARADVTHQDRFAACRSAIDAEFGLRLGSINEVRRKITWRGTRRLVRVQLANVRRLSYAGQDNQFQPARDEEGLILVDYPFDEEPGHGRADDVTTVQNARKRGRQWAVGWLPEHFNQPERMALDNVAAVRRIRKEKPRYLADYAPKVAATLLRSLESYLSNQEAQLGDALKRVYLGSGQLHALSDRLDGMSQDQRDPQRIVESFALEILDRRYPRHPKFKRLVTARDLSDVAGKVVEAAVSGGSVEVRTREEDLIDSYAVPLELVHPGQGTITARTDGRYLTAIKRWIGDRSSFPAAELQTLLSDDEGADSYGLPEEVVQFFVWYLLNVEGYALERISTQASLTVEKLTNIKLSEVQLRKAEIVPLKVWDAARSVAESVLGIDDVPDLVTVPEQSRLSRRIIREADRLARSVQGLYAAMKEPCEMAGVALDDSLRAQTCKAFDASLREWVADQTDPERVSLVAGVHGSTRFDEWNSLLHPKPDVDGLSGERSALAEVKNSAWAYKQVARRGNDAQKTQVVTALRNLLKDPVQRRLAEHAVEWAKTARRIAEALISEPPPPPPLPPPPNDDQHVETGAGKAQPASAVRARLEALIAKMTTDAIDFDITLREKKRP